MTWTTGVTTGATMASEFNALKTQVAGIDTALATLDGDFDTFLLGFDADVDGRILLATLDDLADVVYSGLADGHVLTWDAANTRWRNLAFPGTDLTYDSATRTILSSTGADVALPIFTSTLAGLVPPSGGGTTNFLRADGVWAAPGGGGATNLSYDINTRLLSSDTGTDVVLPPDSGAGRFYAHNDFVSSISDGMFAISVSGTGASVTTVNGVPDGGAGWVQFNLGTTATGRAAVLMSSNTLRFGIGRVYYANRARLSVLSNATDTYSFRAGLLESVVADSVDGAYFRYRDAFNGGRFEAVTRRNDVETAADTGVLAAINTTYKFEVIVNDAGTSVEFRINGAVVGTITTNIPTGAGRETGAGITFIRSVGTVAITPGNSDYITLEQVFTAAR